MYPHAELTPRFTLATLDYSAHVASIGEIVNVPFTSRGSCHAVILWVDYHLDEELVESTGVLRDAPTPQYYKQSVRFTKHAFYDWLIGNRFFPEPVDVTDACTLEAVASMYANEAAFEFCFDVKR
jgi:hypothetical protein